MKKRRAEIEVFGMSFLDVVCCGFGAVLLLLVISRTGGEPEPASDGDAANELRQAYFKLNDERDTKLKDREKMAAELESSTQTLNRKEAELAEAQQTVQSARDTLDTLSMVSDQVENAQMTADARLQRITPTSRDEVGGIPVDSEYIIFVIDTSGSMQQIWSRVRTEVQSILNIHPKVKGIQVMNDMGEYMFSDRAKAWIPDSPKTRQLIQARMATWAAYSNSSPVEGIERAISDFYDPSRAIGIYVLGDEFGGSSTEAVLESVRKLNRKSAGGDKKVRIHGIGFVTAGPSAANYAKLMRQLTHENGGTFLALE